MHRVKEKKNTGMLAAFLTPQTYCLVIALLRTLHGGYSLIAFDERVAFWLHLIRSLPCVCAYFELFARRLAYNHYTIAHAYHAANAHAQGSDRAR